MIKPRPDLRERLSRGKSRAVNLCGLDQGRLDAEVMDQWWLAPDRIE